jgi:tricorn protease
VRTVFLDGDDDEIAPDVSPDGQWIAYVSDVSGDDQVYVARNGTVEELLPADLTFKDGTLGDPRFSPDGRRLVVSVGTKEIWMIDLMTQTPTLLSEDGFYPIWSPDGTEVIYGSTRGKSFDVYRAVVDLSRPETLLLDAENNQRTMDWSAQGIVVLREEIPNKGMDLYTWSDLDDPSVRTVFLDGDDDEIAPGAHRLPGR